MEKSVSRFVPLLILCSFLVILPKNNIVKASETIYIRADGSVDPSTASIERNGEIYTVIGDFDDFVVLERNNTVFDGAGHTVGGIYGKLPVQVDNQSQIDSINNITVVNTIINGDGIFFLNASNLIIANNTLNNGRGLDCTGNRNIIANNTVNSGRGISGRGNGNIISGNHVTNCNYTFVPNNPSPYGIIVGGSNNTLIGNYIIGTNGTAINVGTSSNNTIVGNHIADNKVGVYTLNIYSQGGAHGNIIYYNNFTNNIKDVENDVIITTAVSVNSWDNGTIGNYWSDYEERYPNATEIDGSGIWDTPYVIDEYNQDNYPLMNPVVIPEFPDDGKPTTPTTEPFPTTWVVAAIVIMAVGGAALLVYFAKGKKTTGKVEK
jgi:hypothetical protein